MAVKEKLVSGASTALKIYDVMGATAGAGSGDFHHYRNGRRKEMFRVKAMEGDWKQKQEPPSPAAAAAAAARASSSLWVPYRLSALRFATATGQNHFTSLHQNTTRVSMKRWARSVQAFL